VAGKTQEGKGELKKNQRGPVGSAPTPRRGGERAKGGLNQEPFAGGDQQKPHASKKNVGGETERGLKPQKKKKQKKAKAKQRTKLEGVKRGKKQQKATLKKNKRSKKGVQGDDVGKGREEKGMLAGHGCR